MRPPVALQSGRHNVSFATVSGMRSPGTVGLIFVHRCSGIVGLGILSDRESDKGGKE